MRVLLATDAWRPQVNGVVRSIEHTVAALATQGVTCELLTPQSFRTVPLPTYAEIPLASATARQVAALLGDRRFDAVHVATEGPIGWAVRRYCLRRGLPFTTSYHTRFPEYLRARLPVPIGWTYAWLRRFHAAAVTTLVSTETLRLELGGRGFARLAVWSRGVDTELFRPRAGSRLGRSGPVFLSVGRLAVEKNVEAFLSLALPGTKVVVGDGPDRRRLAQRHPDAVFLGTRTGRDLAEIYAAADVFVFPSLTDTFGIVLLEALASGVPVAALPGGSAADIIGDSGAGILDPDLGRAALAALSIPPALCRARAMHFSWDRSSRQFLSHLVPASPIGAARTA